MKQTAANKRLWRRAGCMLAESLVRSLGQRTENNEKNGEAESGGEILRLTLNKKWKCSF